MKNKLILAILGFFLLFIILFCSSKLINVENGWERLGAILTTILVLYTIISFSVLRINFVSIQFFVFAFLIVFHLGNIIIVGFSTTTISYIENLMIYRYGGDTYSGLAIFYSLLFSLFYTLGIILFHKPCKKPSRNYYLSDLEQMHLFRCGLIFFVISIIPSLYVLYIASTTKSSDGYAAIYYVDYSFHGFSIGFLTNFLFPSIIMLILGSINRKKRFFIMSFLAILYYALEMFLTGRRGDGFLPVLVIILLVEAFYPIKRKLLLLVLGYLSISALSYIAQTRSSGGTFIDIIVGYLKYLVRFDAISDFLLEAGGTIRSPLLIIKSMDQIPNYRLGLTYALGPIAALLNGLRITGALRDYLSFDYFLTNGEAAILSASQADFMGGSCIAEAYFNFGIFAPLVGFAFAYFMQRFSRNKKNKPISLLFTFVCFYWVLRFVRGYYMEMFWILSYTFVSIFVFFYLMHGFTKHREQSLSFD